MEVESAKCDCCGLREDCTQDYIREVKAEFEGGWWLCGLCAEAVRDELAKGGKKKKGFGVVEATRAHMAFCRKFRSNPAVRVADGMRMILRRVSSGDTATPPATGRKCGRPTASAQVGDDRAISPS